MILVQSSIECMLKNTGHCINTMLNSISNYGGLLQGKLHFLFTLFFYAGIKLQSRRPDPVIYSCLYVTNQHLRKEKKTEKIDYMQ